MCHPDVFSSHCRPRYFGRPSRLCTLYQYVRPHFLPAANFTALEETEGSRIVCRQDVGENSAAAKEKRKSSIGLARGFLSRVEDPAVPAHSSSVPPSKENTSRCCLECGWTAHQRAKCPCPRRKASRKGRWCENIASQSVLVTP